MNKDDIVKQEEIRLIIYIANLHYKDGWTQRRISKKLGLSTSRISTLLSKATEKGIVEFSILDPFSTLSSLEDKMKKKFNLNYINIISGPFINENTLLSKLGLHTALYLQRIIRKNYVVGISGGSTLHSMVSSDLFNIYCPAKVVPIIGGVSSTNYNYTSNAIAARLAKQIGGSYNLVPYPTYVSLSQTRSAIMKDKSASGTLNIAKSADLIVLGIGTQPFRVLELSHIRKQDIQLIYKKGVVAEMGGHFLNKKGEPVITDFEQKIVGIGLEDIKKSSNVIAVAGGEKKLTAIKSALLSGIIDTLIIDEPTALKIIRS